MNFIKPLTGNELFQLSTSKERVIEMLKRRIKPTAMFLILSQLGSSNQENSEVFKGDFLKYMDRLLEQTVHEQPEHANVAPNARERLLQVVSQRPIYFSQGLFTMWKYILVYCEPPAPPTSLDVFEQYELVFPLCMRVGDVLSEQSCGTEVEKFQAFVFGERPNFAQSLMRTLVLYCIIPKKKERYKQAYFDFEFVFENKYGISLLDYVTALFALYSTWQKKIKDVNGKIREDWYQSISTAFEKSVIAGVINDIIKPLCFSFEEGRAGCIHSVSEPWDFKFFHDHPLYLFPDDSIIPVSLPVLEYALTEGLFWKIRHCFPKDDVRFQNFFGMPLERYVFDMVSGACNQSSSKYVVYPEFKFGPKTERRDSPDVIVRVGKKVLAIEVKAKRLRYDKSVVGGELTSIHSDQQLMAVDPMMQLYECVEQILVHRCEEMDGATEIHLISVTLGEFPHLPSFEDEIRKEWGKLQGIDVKVYLHRMCIEDVEVLSGLLTKRGRAVFDILRQASKSRYISFRRFLFRKGITVRNPHLFTEEISALLKNAAANIFDTD